MMHKWILSAWVYSTVSRLLITSVGAEKPSGNGVHPRYLNISDSSPRPASSSLDPASFSSLDQASDLLPQAPADYCGLCIIEAPGGIRLVYWVCISSEQSFPFVPTIHVARHVAGASDSRTPSRFSVAPALCLEKGTLIEHRALNSPWVVFHCSIFGLEEPILILESLQEPDDVGLQANVTANPTQPYTIVDNDFT